MVDKDAVIYGYELMEVYNVKSHKSNIIKVEYEYYKEVKMHNYVKEEPNEKKKDENLTALPYQAEVDGSWTALPYQAEGEEVGKNLTALPLVRKKSSEARFFMDGRS